MIGEKQLKEEGKQYEILIGREGNGIRTSQRKGKLRGNGRRQRMVRTG